MPTDLALVFDVNVWVDAAVYVNEARGLPSVAGHGDHDPYLSAALCFTFFTKITTPKLALFSDDLIFQVAHLKLIQPLDAERPEDRGLGWESLTATSRLDILTKHADDTERSFKVNPPANQGSLGMDYEDRRVFGLLEYAATCFPEMLPIMVTNDRKFANEINTAAAAMRRTGMPKWGAMSPTRFVASFTKHGQ